MGALLHCAAALPVPLCHLPTVFYQKTISPPALPISAAADTYPAPLPERSVQRRSGDGSGGWAYQSWYSSLSAWLSFSALHQAPSQLTALPLYPDPEVTSALLSPWRCRRREGGAVHAPGAALPAAQQQAAGSRGGDRRHAAVGAAGLAEVRRGVQRHDRHQPGHGEAPRMSASEPRSAAVPKLYEWNPTVHSKFGFKKLLFWKHAGSIFS